MRISNFDRLSPGIPYRDLHFSSTWPTHECKSDSSFRCTFLQKVGDMGDGRICKNEFRSWLDIIEFYEA